MHVCYHVLRLRTERSGTGRRPRPAGGHLAGQRNWHRRSGGEEKNTKAGAPECTMGIQQLDNTGIDVGTNIGMPGHAWNLVLAIVLVLILAVVAAPRRCNTLVQ